MPEARHVVLVVNGQNHGLYLEYEDPDDKRWLVEKLGDASGDLYKAAYDLPNEPRYFATLEYLGDEDADYAYHYRKKLNNNGLQATNYAALREFLGPLNMLSDDELPGWLETHFDVDKFIRYLVVSNFISNWDGYPHRPKNFWIYEVRAAGRWLFIPWDLDGTFQPGKFGLNPMGVDASVFFQFDSHEPYDQHVEEGTERPLVRRMMVHDVFRQAYLNEYRRALGSHLDLDYLLARVDALEALVVAHAPPGGAASIQQSASSIRAFVRDRHDNVTRELAQP